MLIALVVAARDGEEGEQRFLAVQERDGWYLPAGGVEFASGECFASGALREAAEESGLPDVRLAGVLRVEYRWLGPCCRLRVVFAARAAASPSPLSLRHETTAAAWLRCAELAARRLRHPEALRLFEFARAGARVHPLALVRGRDSDSFPLFAAGQQRPRACRTAISVAVAVRCSGAVVVVVVGATAESRRRRRWALPAMQPIAKAPQAAAAELCRAVGCEAGCTGFLGLAHAPPRTQDDIGRVCFVFGGEVSSAGSLRALGFELLEITDESVADATDLPDVVAMAREFAAGTLEPVPASVIAEEGSPLFVR